jgi:hypothetical protein
MVGVTRSSRCCPNTPPPPSPAGVHVEYSTMWSCTPKPPPLPPPPPHHIQRTSSPPPAPPPLLLPPCHQPHTFGVEGLTTPGRQQHGGGDKVNKHVHHFLPPLLLPVYHPPPKKTYPAHLLNSSPSPHPHLTSPPCCRPLVINHNLLVSHGDQDREAAAWWGVTGL